MTSPSPARSTWAIDPDHSTVQFSLQYMGIGVFSARFHSINGAIAANETDPIDSSVTVSMPVESVDVRNKTLYDWLLAKDFFNHEQHPEITFRSTDLERVEASRWHVNGALAIAGRTCPVVLDTVYLGQVHHPFAERIMAAFTAETTIKRSDFGLGWNMPLASGTPALGEHVNVKIYITSFRQD